MRQIPKYSIVGVIEGYQARRLTATVTCMGNTV